MSFQLSGDGPEIYENTMVPLWFGRWAEALLMRVDLQPGERVLDVACGTGVTTRLAKRDVGAKGAVTGLDINAGMLTKAAELAKGMDILWLESDVTEISLPSDHFDTILSQHGYHYFPDKPAALLEFHRVLAPNGRIAFSIWDGHSAYTHAICAALEAYISPEIAAQQRGQRKTPSQDALIDDLSSAGFKEVAVHRQELLIKVPLAAEFVPLHLASMPIAAAFHGLSDDRKTALVDHVAAALKDHIQDGQLVYPDAVNVVTGVK